MSLKSRSIDYEFSKPASRRRSGHCCKFLLLGLICTMTPAMAQQKPSWMQLRDFSPHKKSATQAAHTTTTAQQKKATTPVKANPTTQSNGNYYMKNAPPPQRRKSQQLANDVNADMWVDVSAIASLEFPVPIYHGKETKVMNVGGGFVSGSMYGRQVILQTRDDPYEVFLWYRQNLANTGFHVNEKYPPRALFGQSYMVRGDSDKEQAIVQINPQYDDRGPLTHLQVSVSPKHGVRQID